MHRFAKTLILAMGVLASTFAQASTTSPRMLIANEYGEAKLSAIEGSYGAALTHTQLVYTISAVNNLPIPDGVNELHEICIKLYFIDLSRKISYEYHRMEFSATKRLIGEATRVAKEHGAAIPERILKIKDNIDHGRIELFLTGNTEFPASYRDI
jgi:hypothetical protein